MSKPFTAPPSAGTKSDPAPAGTHVARCVQMLDLGTHEDTYEGETRDRRSVRLTFELPTETKVFKEDEGPKPYFIGRDYTFSMHPKSALRGFLQVWRGVPFTDEEANSFDIGKLIGAPALVSISHKPANDKIYARLDSAVRLPKGMICPPQVSESLLLHLDDFGTPEFSETMAKLPEWVRKKIESSDEYLGYYAEPALPKATVGAKADGPDDGDGDTDFPF